MSSLKDECVILQDRLIATNRAIADAVEALNRLIRCEQDHDDFVMQEYCKEFVDYFYDATRCLVTTTEQYHAAVHLRSRAKEGWRTSDE